VHTGVAAATDFFAFAAPIARFVRWDVTATNSTVLRANGAAEMAFYGVVPEPASAALLVTGLALAAATRPARRRR